MTWTFASHADWLALLGLVGVCGSSGWWTTTQMMREALDPERYSGTGDSRAAVIRQTSRSILWARRLIVGLSLLIAIWSGAELTTRCSAIELPGDGTARLRYLAGTVTLQLSELRRAELLVQRFARQQNLRLRLIGPDGRDYTSLAAREDDVAREAHSAVLIRSGLPATIVERDGLFGAERTRNSNR